MRSAVTVAKLEEFMKRLGRSAKSPGVIYLTGGATALILRIRDQTVDIDIKMDPEPAGAFEAIAELKDALAVNVELASPDQFIPPLPGWNERSALIGTYGKVEFRHYDFYGQALSKIERGNAKDLSDARALVGRDLINPKELERLALSVIVDLIRYPAVEKDDFLLKLKAFLSEYTDGQAS